MSGMHGVGSKLHRDLRRADQAEERTYWNGGVFDMCEVQEGQGGLECSLTKGMNVCMRSTTTFEYV